jgi:hypothetical protein
MTKPDSAPAATSPSRNDGLTVTCPVCGRAFQLLGRRRFCTDACRQTAWRRRHPAALLLPSVPTPRAPIAVVYECPACAARYLGEQRCADCQRFCRRVGPGGSCPHCDEPVAIADLISTEGR